MLARRGPAHKSDDDAVEEAAKPSAPLFSEISNHSYSYPVVDPVLQPAPPSFIPVPPPVLPMSSSVPLPAPPAYQPYTPVQPSAPLPPSYLDHLSYDQIAAWWNGLNVNHRRAMIGQGVQLTKAQIVQLRGRYYQYLPKDYYPKITQNPDQLGASDYYLIFYLYEELSQKITESRLYFNWMEVDVYGKKSAFKAAFEAPPPSYDEATAWWARLTSGDRQQFIERNQDPKKIYMIHQAFRPYYRYRNYSKRS